MVNGKSLSRRAPTQNRQEVTLGSEHPLNFNSPILDSFFNSSKFCKILIPDHQAFAGAS